MNPITRNESKSMDFVKKERLGKKDFAKIYEAYYERVLEYLFRKVSNRAVAEDLTSEVFEKILKTVSDFQWQGISISAWIFRIAKNHLIDYYRKTNKYKNDKSIDEITNIVSNLPNADMELEEDDTNIELYNSLKELEDKDQYLIYYKFFEDLSNKEIADLTGLTETNIGTRLHRIRKRLAKFLKAKAR